MQAHHVAYLYEAFLKSLWYVSPCTYWIMLLKQTISITYYLLPELKDLSNIVLNSSESRSNGRAIVVVVRPTTFVYICQNVLDLHFANSH